MRMGSDSSRYDLVIFLLLALLLLLLLLLFGKTGEESVITQVGRDRVVVSSKVGRFGLKWFRI